MKISETNEVKIGFKNGSLSLASENMYFMQFLHNIEFGNQNSEYI